MFYFNCVSHEKFNYTFLYRYDYELYGQTHVFKFF